MPGEISYHDTSAVRFSASFPTHVVQIFVVHPRSSPFAIYDRWSALGRGLLLLLLLRVHVKRGSSLLSFPFPFFKFITVDWRGRDPAWCFTARTMHGIGTLSRRGPRDKASRRAKRARDEADGERESTSNKWKRSKTHVRDRSSMNSPVEDQSRRESRSKGKTQPRVTYEWTRCSVGWETSVLRDERNNKVLAKVDQEGSNVSNKHSHISCIILSNENIYGSYCLNVSFDWKDFIIIKFSSAPFFQLTNSRGDIRKSYLSDSISVLFNCSYHVIQHIHFKDIELVCLIILFYSLSLSSFIIFTNLKKKFFLIFHLNKKYSMNIGPFAKISSGTLLSYIFRNIVQ